MKTAVSIPDELFQKAETLAKRQRKARSTIYAEALKAYLEQQDDSSVTEELNQLYSKHSSELEPEVAVSQAQIMRLSDW